MCGLVGLIDLKRHTAAAELARLAGTMAETLTHRGPDDAGVWVDEEAGLALGFRRLSIIDLSPAGHQPMISASGRHVIVYNGEIYNAAQLRPELEAKGVVFRGHSDTEVILEACEAWGVSAAVARFIGMFAFAIWDRRERRLHLVRDRLGIKPLYYGRLGQTFFFGSQPKSFFPHPDWRARLDVGALAEYLRFNYIPNRLSIYQGLRQVAPGGMVTVGDVSPEDGSYRLREDLYWDFRAVAHDGVRRRFRGDLQEAAEELESLLREAVACRMIADVPLGAFLSGGIDSSTVVALMQAESSAPVKTYSIGFPEADYDEAPYAKSVAEHLETDHHELRVSASDALALVAKIPEWYDEPSADSSAIPTYLVSKFARTGVTVSLSGDGGDELFGGYPWYGFGRMLGERLAVVPAPLRHAAAGGLRFLSHEAWDSLARVVPRNLRPERVGDRVHKLALLLGLPNPDEVYRYLVGQWHDPAAVSPLVVRRDDGDWRGTGPEDVPDFTERMMYFDTLSYLPDDILTKVDRASMAVGLEARVPLLDHRVVEFAWRLPRSFKIEGSLTKRVLRQVLQRHVPKALFDRPKQGFEQPIVHWLRGPLRDWAEDNLNERQLSSEGIFDPAPIRARWQEHLSGRRNWQYPIWNILMFQEWKRHWM